MLGVKNVIFSKEQFYIRELAEIFNTTRSTIKTLTDSGKLNGKVLKTGHISRSLFSWKHVAQTKELLGIKHKLKNKVIVVQNCKGGVGKTSLATNLSFEANYKGMKTLCIDLDAQGHLTYNLGATVNAKTKTFRDCLNSRGQVIEGAIKKSVVSITPLLDLLPSTINLNDTDYLLRVRSRRSEFALEEAIEEICDNYDLIIIDTNPSVNLMLTNALMVANLLVIPALTDFASHMALDYCQKIMKEMFPKKNERPELAIVPNRYNDSKNICRDSLKAMMENYSANICPVCIRESTDIEHASKDQKSLRQYKKTSRGTKDFIDLANYILKE